MEEKKQEVKNEKLGIVVLDRGIEVVGMEEDVRLGCCAFSLIPIR